MLKCLFFRKRPRAAAGLERSIDVFSSHRDARYKKTLQSTLGTKKAAKDVKAKSISTLLERVRALILVPYVISNIIHLR